MNQRDHEIIIIGGGPGGTTAAIYCVRARRRTLLVEKQLVGGQMLLAGKIENYPGFPQGVSGFELAEKLQEHIKTLEVETAYEEVTQLKIEEANKVVITDKAEHVCKAVIVAPGASPKRLGVPGEQEFTGRGVSYCAICDARFFKDREVVVVGGGDTALDDALLLARFARRVRVIHRRAELRGARILQERAFEDPKIEFVWDSVVDEIQGSKMVESITIRNLRSGDQGKLQVDGVFMCVGYQPQTDFLRGVLELTEEGYVQSDEQMMTNIEGIYAIGDIRDGTPKQIVVSAGQGAVAALAADKYLSELSK